MNVEKELLENQKKELEQGFNELQLQFEQVKENALRCPFTNLYYQNVLSETLMSELAKLNESNCGLLLIQLDQLIDLNKRYGKETGNESIRNMAYTISGLLSKNQHIFKQYGPGIYLLDTQATKESLKDLTKHIKSAIRESSVFIEKVSVSITSVIEDEISKELSSHLQVNSFFDLLDKRMLLLSSSSVTDLKEEESHQTTISEGKILLVDEDEMNRNMLFRIFKRMNYEVVLAQSVEQAIELVKLYKIDIIISEINLSKIDGFQLKQMLNEYDEYRQIPFFMVSHNKTLENIKRGNALDVDLMIAKPIIADELVGHIKRFKDKWSKR
jgi:PleD family two-component response regulator